MSFKIVPFTPGYAREDFSCGTPALDMYLKRYASQDMRRNFAVLSVAVKDDINRILGYYTLSNACVDTRIIPDLSRTRFPKYNDIPAIRLGRLAVDRSVQGQGLGARLLANAVIESTSNTSAWALMVVDAKDSIAYAFYRKFGFESLKDDTNHLVVQRKNLELLFYKS